MKKLSKTEKDRRKPLPPYILIDALQDSIHKDECGRVAKTFKVKKNEVS